MRGAVDRLPSPHPIGEILPSAYRTDQFTQQLCASFDEVLAPVISALDNLPAYLDLGTAPEDILPWLAHWLGLAVDRGDNPLRQRELLRSTRDLHGRQGTRLGIELAISAVLGVRTEVVESGGASWSVDPNDPLPGEALPAVVVQVFPVAGQEIDEDRLRDAVAALKPAHVIHRVQVVPVD
jgi:phage tail-like protein